MNLLRKAKKAGKQLMAKLGIGGKEKPKNPKEHKAQVDAGMTYLHQQEKALDKDGNKSLTQEEANKVAANTKKKFKVFTSITPKEVGGKWVYEWKGSNGKEVGAKVDKKSERVLATDENKKIAREKLKKVTLNDIDNKVDEDTFERYKKGPGDSYLSYIDKRNESQEMDWPLEYLKRRSSLKQGKTDELFWIRKRFGDSAKKNENSFNIRHLNSENEMVMTTVIPDYITGNEIGDVKNVKHQSYVNQLRAIYALSVQKRKDFSLITKTDTTFTGTFPVSMIKHQIITKDKSDV